MPAGDRADRVTGRNQHRGQSKGEDVSGAEHGEQNRKTRRLPTMGHDGGHVDLSKLDKTRSEKLCAFNA